MFACHKCVNRFAQHSFGIVLGLVTHTHTISSVYSQISVLNNSVSKDVYFFFVPGVVITVASYFY